MRVYIASGVKNSNRVGIVRELCEKHGIEITFDWEAAGPVDTNDQEAIIDRAVADYEGVQRADVLIALMPGGPGTHFEMGVAMGQGTPIFLVDAEAFPVEEPFEKEPEKPRVCVFHHLPRGITRIHSFPSLEATLVARLTNPNLYRGSVVPEVHPSRTGPVSLPGPVAAAPVAEGRHTPKRPEAPSRVTGEQEQPPSRRRVGDVETRLPPR